MRSAGRACPRAASSPTRDSSFVAVRTVAGVAGDGIRPRFGYLGEPASIAIAERFIRSMKQECFRRLDFVPTGAHAVRRELWCFAIRYNEHRPHVKLNGRTPSEVVPGRTRRRLRLEPRPRWPHRRRQPVTSDSLRLEVGYVEGRKHLPVITLRHAA